MTKEQAKELMLFIWEMTGCGKPDSNGKVMPKKDKEHAYKRCFELLQDHDFETAKQVAIKINDNGNGLFPYPTRIKTYLEMSNADLIRNMSDEQLAEKLNLDLNWLKKRAVA